MLGDEFAKQPLVGARIGRREGLFERVGIGVGIEPPSQTLRGLGWKPARNGACSGAAAAIAEQTAARVREDRFGGRIDGGVTDGAPVERRTETRRYDDPPCSGERRRCDIGRRRLGRSSRAPSSTAPNSSAFASSPAMRSVELRDRRRRTEA